MSTRTLVNLIESVATSDGAGVKLRRSLGSRQNLRADPFLMLDEFFSDDPRDYIAGFPPHPHRGFETVTYMLDGHLRHEDHLGNRGDLKPGDVQWMTAAHGIVHSEMPQQTEGRMRGFQLWINLPAKEKMLPASYRDIPAREIHALELASGARVKVIAGTAALDGQQLSGPVNGPGKPLSTDPLYLDIALPARASLRVPITAGHNAVIYVYEGELRVGGTGSAGSEGSAQSTATIPARAAGVLSDGDGVELLAGSEPTRALLLAGRPLGEPVVQYGPFVMNTRAEIEQAIEDFQRGKLG
ncbi:MAG: pirin family protein [Steroidobacteraceae bacterium]